MWFTLKEHGTKRLGAKIAENCRQARYLGELVERSPSLQLLALVTLNIVCFRFASPDLGGMAPALVDQINRDIVIELQESGFAAPSLTRIGAATAIRVNLTNHRTVWADLDAFVAAVIHLGHALKERYRSSPGGHDEGGKRWAAGAAWHDVNESAPVTVGASSELTTAQPVSATKG